MRGVPAGAVRGRFTVCAGLGAAAGWLVLDRSLSAGGALALLATGGWGLVLLPVHSNRRLPPRPTTPRAVRELRPPARSGP